MCVRETGCVLCCWGGELSSVIYNNPQSVCVHVVVDVDVVVVVVVVVVVGKGVRGICHSFGGCVCV